MVFPSNFPGLMLFFLYKNSHLPSWPHRYSLRQLLSGPPSSEDIKLSTQSLTRARQTALLSPPSRNPGCPTGWLRGSEKLDKGEGVAEFAALTGWEPCQNGFPTHSLHLLLCVVCALRDSE